jgi:hypothetical protein
MRAEFKKTRDPKLFAREKSNCEGQAEQIETIADVGGMWKSLLPKGGFSVEETILAGSCEGSS